MVPTTAVMAIQQGRDSMKIIDIGSTLAFIAMKILWLQVYCHFCVPVCGRGCTS